MKLVRYGPVGQEKPGILDDKNQLCDLSPIIQDIDGSSISPESLEALQKIDKSTLQLVEGIPRIGSCVGHVGNLICIGLNYLDHAKESGKELPKEPVVFMKPSSCIAGPNDPVPIPRGANTVDWEVELAIVMGKRAKYITKEQAPEYIAGYTIFHDVSERTFQTKRAGGVGHWFKGKCCDGFGPLGPFLVTADEIPDPQSLRIWLEVNDERMQNGNTSDMHRSCYEIVSHLSEFMTLHPGDVIATGTPAGVGMGQRPPRFLQPGDQVRLGIEGLGEQQQKFVKDF